MLTFCCCIISKIWLLLKYSILYFLVFETFNATVGISPASVFSEIKLIKCSASLSASTVKFLEFPIILLFAINTFAPMDNPEKNQKDTLLELAKSKEYKV